MGDLDRRPSNDLMRVVLALGTALLAPNKAPQIHRRTY
jgi:hypothetical protein